MSRALNVALGCILIFNLWCWALLSISKSDLVDPTVWTGAEIIGRLFLGCLMTGPIYREYLR